MPIGHEPHRGRLWWAFLGSGLLFIAFGIAILFVPRTATRLVVTLLGILAAFLGHRADHELDRGAQVGGRVRASGWSPGILLVAGGVATVVFAEAVSRLLRRSPGRSWRCSPARGTSRARSMNRQAGRWWRLARGVVLVAAGAVFFIAPMLGVAAAGVLVGLACIGVGVASLAIALATRRTGI